jgi:hypothetical protein
METHQKRSPLMPNPVIQLHLRTADCGVVTLVAAIKDLGLTGENRP